MMWVWVGFFLILLQRGVTEFNVREQLEKWITGSKCCLYPTVSTKINVVCLTDFSCEIVSY
jgi:hypothetical protein